MPKYGLTQQYQNGVTLVSYQKVGTGQNLKFKVPLTLFPVLSVNFVLHTRF